MKDFLIIVYYILIANISYLIFSLIRQGFRHYCNYIAELIFLIILTVYLFLKGIAVGWVVSISFLGVCVLVFIPHLLQAKIDSLLSENLYDEIEPYARLKSALAWSEPNSHLYDIARIAEENYEHVDKMVKELRELLGRGEPYDGMTRLFLGMIHFNHRNFHELIKDVKIPDKEFKSQSFEELLYLVRGYLETTRYEEAVEAQFALEEKIYEDRDAKIERTANAVINRLVFFAFLGWKNEYDSFLKTENAGLERLPFELREFWRGVCYFYSGEYEIGERMMRTVIGNLPRKENLWHDFMMKRMLGMVEHKEFFHKHILAKLVKLHEENSQKLTLLVSDNEEANKEIPLKTTVTNMLAFVTLFISSIWILICNTDDPIELMKIGGTGYYFWNIGEYCRNLTYMFVHSGWSHLLLNIFSLRYFGGFVETIVGWPLLLAVYFISGVVGGVVSASCGSNLTVGASGGIFGLLGAATVFCIIVPKIESKVTKPISLSALLFMLFVNLVIGVFGSRIDNYAHIGGLLTGILISFVAIPSTKSRRIKKVYGVFSVMSVLIIIVYGVGMHLYNSFYRLAYPKSLRHFEICDSDKLGFRTELPKEWKIDSEELSLNCLNAVGCFGEKIRVALWNREANPVEYLSEYIVERTNAFERENNVELISVVGPNKVDGTNNQYRTKWIFKYFDVVNCNCDYFVFKDDYGCVIRLTTASLHIDDYSEIIDRIINTIEIK